MAASRWKVGEMREMLVKGYKLLVIREVSPEDLMYSMMTVLNDNTVLHT